MERDAATDAVKSSLSQDRIGDRTYWFQAGHSPVNRPSTSTFLLPNYDEFLIAYRDRGPVVRAAGQDAFGHHLILDGRLAGSWRRTVKKNSLLIEVAPYSRPTPSHHRSIVRAADRLGKFMIMPIDARVRMGA